MAYDNEMVTARQPAPGTVGARIREARGQAGMTQQELADVLEVTQAAVSRWESGERDLGTAELIQAADALGVQAASLLPPEPWVPAPAAPAGGYWACIAFMGHNEHTGYVREIVKNGQPAYQVDLPDKIWGGDPASSVKYAATAWVFRAARD